MTDREKVLKGLECLITNEPPCEGCPYNGSGNCRKNIAKDARELLKELPVVVKCKNCKFWLDPIRCQMYSEGMLTDGNWFCADGEKEVK